MIWLQEMEKLSCYTLNCCTETALLYWKTENIKKKEAKNKILIQQDVKKYTRTSARNRGKALRQAMWKCPCGSLQLYIHSAWLSQFWFSSAVSLASFHSGSVTQISLNVNGGLKLKIHFVLLCRSGISFDIQNLQKDIVHLGNKTKGVPIAIRAL